MPFQPGNRLGKHGNHAKGFECRNKEMLQKMKWVKKGEECVRIDTADFQTYIEAGWGPGRLSPSAITRTRQGEAQRARIDHRREANTPQGRRKRQYKCRYKKTPEEYDETVTAQGGHCALCPSTGSVKRRLCWDHDHACCPGYASCGKCVRGLLCIACNNLLGRLETFLWAGTFMAKPGTWEEKALQYLSKYMLTTPYPLIY